MNKKIADNSMQHRRNMHAALDAQPARTSTQTGDGAAGGAAAAAEATAGGDSSAAQRNASITHSTQRVTCCPHTRTPHTSQRGRRCAFLAFARRENDSLDGQPAEQQHRSGTHAPHALAADLAQAAEILCRPP